MKVEFALRDEKLNIFAMAHGNINLNTPYQIMICKRNKFKENRKGPFLLDSKISKSDFLPSKTGRLYLDKIKSQRFDLKYIAIIDEQLEIDINQNIFNKLCTNGYFQIWNPESPIKYFKGKEKGYIILLRVYEIDTIVDERLLERGRSGRNYYYGLTDSVECKIKRPVLSDDEYSKVKNSIIKLIQNDSDRAYVNSIYEEADNIVVKDIEEEIVYSRNHIDGNESFKEGSETLVIHKRKERNRIVIEKAKKLFKLKHNNRLFCEVCGFDFEEVYGDIGKNFIEGHHAIPISEMNENDETKVDDIIMVCSNCHRMIHRKKTLLAKKDLKKMLR